MSVSLEQPFSAVSGPDTTEIVYRDDQEQLNPPSTIEITNDGDKPYQVDHPWIKDHVPVDRDGRIEPTTPVTVAYPRGHDFTMNFEQYLLTIGLNYDRYLTYYRHHPGEDRDSDLRRMHQAAIEHRGQTARYLKDKWRKENSEAQQNQSGYCTPSPVGAAGGVVSEPPCVIVPADIDPVAPVPVSEKISTSSTYMWLFVS
jgi:hypothetical protein